MKNQLDNMEKLYMEAKDEVIQVNEEKLAVLNEYEGGATRVELEKQNVKLEELKIANEQLKLKCEKCTYLLISSRLI